MSAVLPFKQPEQTAPHLVGRAGCFGCGHKWEGVAPTGTVELECPECKTMKGRFRNIVECAEEDVWTCRCGSTLFHWYKTSGALCPNCGTWQRF